MSKKEIIESDLDDFKSKLASILAEGFSDVVMSCFEALREAIRSSFAGDATPCSEDSTESVDNAGTDIDVDDVDSGTDKEDIEVEEQ